MHKDCEKILFTEQQIADRCKQLGEIISNDYKLANKCLLVVGVLRGSMLFMSELIKRIDCDVEIDFVICKSYEGTESVGDIKIIKDLECSATGRDILIIEDIVDTGKTLYELKNLLNHRGANSVKVAALLNKQERRICPINADYVGFEIANEFVIGYGLDFDQKYRNLPYVGVLRRELY